MVSLSFYLIHPPQWVIYAFLIGKHPYIHTERQDTQLINDAVKNFKFPPKSNHFRAVFAMVTQKKTNDHISKIHSWWESQLSKQRPAFLYTVKKSTQLSYIWHEVLLADQAEAWVYSTICSLCQRLNPAHIIICSPSYIILVTFLFQIPAKRQIP